jgi:hypothetical protein
MHYYRLEISGRHTGSSFRFHSAIFGTLAEVAADITDECQTQDGLAFLIGEGASFMLELYEEGELRGEWNLFPAVKLRMPDGELRDLAGIKDAEPLLECEIEPEPIIDFSPLALPEPAGEPLHDGEEISYVRDGKPGQQEYGIFDDWNERAHKPRSVPN